MRQKRMQPNIKSNELKRIERAWPSMSEEGRCILFYKVMMELATRRRVWWQVDFVLAGPIVIGG